MEEANQPPDMFTELVMVETKRFTEFLLSNFAELEGVAVTLSWRPPLMNLPTAVLRGRNGGLTSTGEVTHMMEQLLAAVRHLQNQLDASLRVVDTIMAQKADTLRQLEQKIERKSATLHGFQKFPFDRERPAASTTDAVTHNDI